MNCPTCNKPAHNIRTAIHNRVLITNCEHCSKLIQPSAMAARNRREQMKKDYRRDLTQPVDQRAFTAAYPDQARKLYGDEQFRKIS